MKKFLFVLMLIPLSVFSQEKTDSIKSWNFGGLASLSFSQVSLTNWAAGGRSSSSGVAIFNVFGNYKRNNLSWENSLDMGYGLLKEQDNEVIKSNDKLDFNSKFGLKQNEKLYYSTLFNFKTQFAPGYKYPNTTDAISRFLAPAYMTLSAGIDYKPNKALSFLISPLTGKTTIVTDQNLSDIGAFGVDPGEKMRMEFGSFFKMELKTEIMKNVSLNSKLDLFSNYLHNPGNIDINWDLLVNMKINDYLSANLITNLIYDDDIKIAVDKNNDGIIESRGPRVQFKEMFGLGLSLKF
ncbi:MAG: hypothetical protein A2066_19665 [Bacteroidetes bacterium GWB2_41_8]|nr:MAG: hypothetical protein A2066_19665 [Bacteroidetes bacterium GWB2_41_8]